MRELGRILVVDDEPEICAVLAEFLESKGLTVATARDGATALRLAGELAPHVVLLDVRMPGMGGLAVLRELRRLPDPPGVILVTAVRDEAVGQEALALGAADYIAKPFDLSYLELSVLTKVTAALGGEPGRRPPRPGDLIRGDEPGR